MISEDQMNELHAEHDVMLIPGARIHSVTVARAMTYGMPIICSDGWGYKEFVQHGVTGFFAEGQNRLTGWVRDVFREDYSKMPDLNEQLVRQVKQYMTKLITQRNPLENMSVQSSQSAAQQFSLGRRNEALKGILDSTLPRL